MAGINLDAILGEADPRPLVYKGVAFELPGELPGAALAPFLDPKLGLVDLVASAWAELDRDDADDDNFNPVEFFLGVLGKRPNLPLELLDAARQSLDVFLGDQAERFYALQPSVPAYRALASNLASQYGFAMSDFFGSAVSSETDGESSKPTSPTTTPDSTPEGSSAPQELPERSEPDASSS